MYIPNSQPLINEWLPTMYDLPSEEQTEWLPTMYDLPSENPEESGLPDEFHDWQGDILGETCSPQTYPADQVFVASDLNLYYDSIHPFWYKRPDFFLVVGVSRFRKEKDLRLSYVIWQEKVSPIVAVEFLSPGTEDEDLGLTYSDLNKPPTKWEVYEQIIKIPYYFVFSRYTNQLKVFKLRRNRYREQILTESRFWIPELELGIGLWLGCYKGCQRLWLRWYDAEGNWIPTPEERAESAIQNAEVERLAKESAIQNAEVERLAKESALQSAEVERLAKESALEKAAKLAARLREMGINPDDL